MKTWNKPGLFVLLGLVLAILIIPTIIVVPYIGTGGSEKQTSPDETDTALVDGSPAGFSVSVFRTKSQEIETMPLELYVARVVASEMPAEFETEALKAQALAARTYIVKYLLNENQTDPLPGGANVSDTIQHQVYKSEDELHRIWGSDFNWKMDKIKKAVAATKGQIITYDGEPITASFFSTSNGYTENSEDYWSSAIPYLRSVASPWDKNSPKYLDQEVFTISKVEKTLGVTLAGQKDFSPIKHTAGNRIAAIKLGKKVFTGREVREKLGLRSSDFTIEEKNNHLIFTTKGYGHGVGMSQYGANGMAQAGDTYQQIIEHYYKGTKISKLDPYLPKLASAQ